MLERFDTMVLVWRPARMLADDADRAKINSVLTGTAGQHYPVGFAVRLVDGEWKIYDLEIEGVSLALNYRAQLSAEITRTSLDAVIARMTARQGKVRLAAP
jgi:phospholipid transport system substrate-binding protein